MIGNMHVNQLPYVQRSIDRLVGILKGLTSDNIMSDAEIVRLREWLDLHKDLFNREPFKDLASMLDAIMEDGVIDEHERLELMEWCDELFASHSPAMQCAKSATNRLHGLLQGIAIDNEINELEVWGLQSWIERFDDLKHCWPFDELHLMLEKVLFEYSVYEQKKIELMEFCQNFFEIGVEPANIPEEDYKRDFRFSSSAPVVDSFTAICDRNAAIFFTDKTFCFTGTAKSGKRKELHAIVEEAGGVSANCVIKSLDYLVIGANSTPAWAFSTYGRKIEKVKELNKKGSNITILHEDDFITQLYA